MKYGKFARYALAALGAFVLLNVLTWKCWTEILLTRKFDGGDLARMGYAPGSKECRKTSCDLPRRHIIMKEYRGQQVDVLTIGDSFSYGGAEGRNSFYQDYIASLNGLTVLNVPQYPSDDLVGFFSPLATLAVLMNSGYLDIIKPRYIIIESAVKYCIPRYARKLELGRSDSLDNVRKHYAKIDYDFTMPGVGFINKGNFNFYYYNLRYLFSDHAFRKKVYRRDLTAPLFTVRDGRKLLFIAEDIGNITLVNKESVKLLNDNFNALSSILGKRGIRLCFMPAVDKYDLYSEFIVDNPYPKNPFFEEMRALPRNYLLIDTKAILAEELRRGEKDIFYADDTHWSWKASRKIFETVRFK